MKCHLLKCSIFSCRGLRVSTISFFFGLHCFEFLFGEVKTPDLLQNLVYIILDSNKGHETKEAKEEREETEETEKLTKTPRLTTCYPES